MSSPGFGAIAKADAHGTTLTAEQPEPVLLRALEIGCTSWDTASAYAAGLNEKLLGDFTRKHNVMEKVFRECDSVRTSAQSKLTGSGSGFEVWGRLFWKVAKSN